MKRQFVGIALFLPLLACLLGASSNAFDAGQPTPNPGGAAKMLQGKGTFVLDPAEYHVGNSFAAVDTKGTKQLYSVNVTATLNKWDGTLMMFPSNYDSYGTLVTYDPVTKSNTAFKTATVNKDVK